jgi:hypothetical protein
MTNPTPQPRLIDDPTPAAGPVTCLGRTFANDAERRAHFTDLLRRKLADPAFRAIEGFPIGSDEAILALSDPPYYTACPNPWLGEFVAEWQATNDERRMTNEEGSYHREPFAADVSEGKTDQLYKAHSYHTKVPHLAIVPSILHYTEPGDLVLDGFCGTGMTGIAAQWCGAAPADYRSQLEAEWRAAGREAPRWGARRAVLNDLSPVATFIAANYNLPFDVAAFAAAGEQLLQEVEAELGWMYATRHTDGTLGQIEYTVWSEVFTCPECANEIVFLDEAFDVETQSVLKKFPCPNCNATLTKRTLDRVFETKPDPVGGGLWRRVKLVPLTIHYRSQDGERHQKEPDEADTEVLQRIEQQPWPAEMPSIRLPVEDMYHGSRIAPKGFTHIHHFFLPRAAHALAALWRKADAHPDPRIRHMLLYFVEQAIWTMTVLNRYRPTGYSQVNQFIAGIFYVPSQHSELSPWYVLEGKLDRLVKAFQQAYQTPNTVAVTTGTAARLDLPDDAIDYIFTDPPFGENIYYADLNYLIESWHGVLTNTAPEAIVDRAKKKGLADYQDLMTACFVEYERVLKPGRWLTVVFHNSHNAVWSAIQEALAVAGFVIADVRTLDKQQGSYRQVTSSAMKQDLVVSAYKPSRQFEEQFTLLAGRADSAWEFVRAHLAQVPVLSSQDGRIEPVRERMADILYDRMVAFHVLRGVIVPLSAAEFRQGLAAKFPARDDMVFLPQQVVEYDKKRLAARELVQLQIFVSDESSAIAWLRQQLGRKPQSFQDLQPQFMQETKGGWQKFEAQLELRDLLEQNFLRYDGAGLVPEQIHSYLSTNYKDLRNLPKDDPALVDKARDRWYVPDPNKAADLEKLRERHLLREFETYRESKLRKLKVFRLEAMRAGFKRAWQAQDYATIVSVARKIPDDVLHGDPKLLMWLDQAHTRLGQGS